MSDPGLRDWLQAQTWSDLRARLEEQDVVTAYEHPYGFIVCRIETNLFEGWQIRLHLWPSRKRMREAMVRNRTIGQQVHAHGWDLLSVVVWGRIEESTYAVEVADPGSEGVYRVVSDYGTGVSRLRLEYSGVQVRTAAREIRAPADGPHLIPRSTYHSTIPVDAPCVTVVATELSGADSFVVAPSSLGSTVANSRGEVASLSDELASFDRLILAAPGDDWAAFVFACVRGEILLVRSTRRPEYWQPIGGRQEPGDQRPLDTVIREAREEVDLDLDASDLELVGRKSRDVGSGDVHFWFAELQARPDLRLQASEILEARWVPIEQLAAYPMYPGSVAVIPRVMRLASREGRP